MPSLLRTTKNLVTYEVRSGMASRKKRCSQQRKTEEEELAVLEDREEHGPVVVAQQPMGELLGLMKDFMSGQQRREEGLLDEISTLRVRASHLLLLAHLNLGKGSLLQAAHECRCPHLHQQDDLRGSPQLFPTAAGGGLE